MIKFKDLIHLTFITILLLTNFLFTTINNEVLVFICTLVIFSSLFLIIKNRLGGYLNITILFLSFWGLYIFIGPFAALWGDGGILFTNYNGPFIVSDYLFYSSLGVVGFSIPFLIHNHPQKLNEPVINFGKILNNTYHLKILMNFGLFIAFLGLIMDTINIYRIGLSNILGIGKAALQSEINNLRFALPSEEFIFISFAIFAISLGVAIKNKFDIKKIFGIRVFILFVITSPILIGWLIYGRRGLLLTVILISIIGIYRFVQTRKLNKKIVIYILIFYILFAFITANRWVINESIKQKDFQLFLESALNIERTIERLALTNNEFVVGLGNFDLFYKGNEEKRYGKTYIDGLLSPIPRFLYPGEKPPGINI